MNVRLALPARGTLQPNDAHDPLPYYYHPWVGWLYRHRLQMGLDLLPAGGRRILEVGVGSGVLVPTLTQPLSRICGNGPHSCPRADSAWWRRAAPRRFRPADLLRDGDLPADSFDAIVCFSVLEHIADSDGAARGLARVLAPGGTLVTGYPMVSPLMTRAFSAIGYQGIDDHHVSPPRKIAAALARVLKPVKRVAFPPAAPLDAALYQCTAWTK